MYISVVIIVTILIWEPKRLYRSWIQYNNIHWRPSLASFTHIIYVKNYSLKVKKIIWDINNKPKIYLGGFFSWTSFLTWFSSRCPPSELTLDVNVELSQFLVVQADAALPLVKLGATTAETGEWDRRLAGSVSRDVFESEFGLNRKHLLFKWFKKIQQPLLY